MATTVGVHRERGARAPPAIPPKVDRRQLLLLLGTLTASVTYQAGLTPPGGLWPNDGGARIIGGDALLHTTYHQRYLVFYCNTTAFAASLAVVLLLLLTKNQASSNQRIKLYALRVALTLGLLCLIGSIVAVSSLSFITSICVVALAAAVVLYISIQMPLVLFKPVAEEISLSSVQESPQKSPKLLISEQKKFLRELTQRVHQDKHEVLGLLGRQNSGNLNGRPEPGFIDGANMATTSYNSSNKLPHIKVRSSGSGDAYQILKKSRMHMILFGTLAASVTCGPGMNTPGEYRILHNKRYPVYFYCNTLAYLASLNLLMSSVVRTGPEGINTCYRSLQAVAVYLLVAYVDVTLDQFRLIEAYVTGSSSIFVVWVSIEVAIHIGEKLFGLSNHEHSEEEEEEEGDDEEEAVDESAVAMELRLEHWRNLLLLIAILAAILSYHASTSPPLDNLVNYRRLAFSYCEATVFTASISIIAMLANGKLPSARGVRWHTMRACVILDVIGLMGAFAARGYWKISTIDVLVLVLAVLLYIVLHVVLSIHATPGGLLQILLLEFVSSPIFIGPDPLQDNGTQHDFEVGMTGGTNQEPLAVEIASPILEGALTLIVAVPVISIVAIEMKLLVGFMIASIGFGLWRRSFARLHQALASALHCRQGTMPSTGSPSSPLEHGMWKLIHTVCSGTWMWIIILVMWVPSLRPNLKLKFKISNILAVLSELVDGTPTPDTTTGTAASTTTTATIVAPTTATSTGVGALIMTAASGGTPIMVDASGTPTTTAESGGTLITADVLGAPITAYASGTSMGQEVQPLLELRPRRNRRVNSRLIGPDWVN